MPSDIIRRRPGSLQVVATPIGNLSDLSARARTVLSEAELILAEDTRRTQQLLNALSLPCPPIERCDAHVERSQAERWIGRVEEGVRVVLVSDAGTPGVSDPGSFLVGLALERRLKVEPIPGPSAVAAMISVCGFFSSSAFGFQGFFPRGERERGDVLRALLVPDALRNCRVWVFFESPERIVSALRLIAEVLPAESLVRAAKELTKVHERIFAGSPQSVSEQVAEEVAREGARGEWLFAFELPVHEAAPAGAASEEKQLNWAQILDVFEGAELRDSDLAKRISKAYGVERRVVYEEILRRSGRKDIGGS